jgi:hypothetical protein
MLRLANWTVNGISAGFAEFSAERQIVNERMQGDWSGALSPGGLAQPGRELHF